MVCCNFISLFSLPVTSWRSVCCQKPGPGQGKFCAQGHLVLTALCPPIPIPIPHAHTTTPRRARIPATAGSGRGTYGDGGVEWCLLQLWLLGWLRSGVGHRWAALNVSEATSQWWWWAS